MDDDEYNNNNANDDATNDEAISSSSGFEGYVETSVDPGYWLLAITTTFCFFVMLVIVPILVSYKRKKNHHHMHESTSSPTSSPKKQLLPKKEDQQQDDPSNSVEQEEVDVTLSNICCFDFETKRILGLAGPFAVQALCSSLCSNACLVLVSQHIGTKAAAAYAIVQVWLGLTDGVLRGPISACTTLCAHAVGAGNSTLAGEYIQLAIQLYLILNLPILLFWGLPFRGMYTVVLYLEWGDEITAQLAQDFTNIYLFSYVFDSISSSVWQLLEITNHAVVGTICSMIWGITNVLILGSWVAYDAWSTSANNNNNNGEDETTTTTNLTLKHVAAVYVGTAMFFVLFTYGLAYNRGWLQPFLQGLHGTCALRNMTAVRLLLTQAVPLSWGYLLSNAEWAILTFMASHLGPAEVAAWALLGSIWDVFYTTTAGIGDAAEIRVSHHLGENSPTHAQLSAYKSLFLGMVVATTVSVVYFCLQDQIPEWFTSDETLQNMLRELVPFVGVANLTMTFGMQCWSLIGAQGKYATATWVSFVSSWGVCMPLAAILTYGFRIDLQGLTAAATIGYVSTGATLSYLLLGTDWYKVARKIQQRNNDTSVGKFDPEGSGSEAAEEMLLYQGAIEVMPRSNTKGRLFAAARHHGSNIKLLTVPAGRRTGIVVGKLSNKPGNYILRVRRWSCLRAGGSASHVVGSAILAVNGQDTTKFTPKEITQLLSDRSMDRIMAVVSPVDCNFVDDNNNNDADSDSDNDSVGSEEGFANNTEYSGIFWNDGFFGYLAAPNGSPAAGGVVKEARDGDDASHDVTSTWTNGSGILQYGFKHLSNLKMARKRSISRKQQQEESQVVGGSSETTEPRSPPKRNNKLKLIRKTTKDKQAKDDAKTTLVQGGGIELV